MQNPEQVMSVRETHPLVGLEERIAQGKQRLLEMGWAMGIVRQLRLYKPEYRSFDKYCRAKWGCSRQRAYRLIEASAKANGHRSVTSEQKTKVN